MNKLSFTCDMWITYVYKLCFTLKCFVKADKIRKTYRVIMSNPFPVRCLTCGTIIANKENAYWSAHSQLDAEAWKPEERADGSVETYMEVQHRKNNKVFKMIGIRRQCCRNEFIAHPNDDS